MPGGIVYKDQKHIFEIRVKITPRCFFVPNVTLLFMFIFFLSLEHKRPNYFIGKLRDIHNVSCYSIDN